MVIPARYYGTSVVGTTRELWQQLEPRPLGHYYHHPTPTFPWLIGVQTMDFNTSNFYVNKYLVELQDFSKTYFSYQSLVKVFKSLFKWSLHSYILYWFLVFIWQSPYKSVNLTTTIIPPPPTFSLIIILSLQLVFSCTCCTTAVAAIDNLILGLTLEIFVRYDYLEWSLFTFKMIVYWFISLSLSGLGVFL